MTKTPTLEPRSPAGRAGALRLLREEPVRTVDTEPATQATSLVRLEAGVPERREDRVAVEEPLEIRLRAGGVERTVAVTMRTPGEDAELAAGFLFGEGIVRSAAELGSVTAPADDPNVVVVELGLPAMPDLAPLERHFFTSSACGVCGKAGLEALALRGFSGPPAGPAVAAATLAALPDRLRAAQGTFATTGGLHAAALFDAAGTLIAAREDVGRHNAVDKLVGWGLSAGRLPFAGGIVLVSGRSSYEILQKCLAAGVPVVCSISAPSSLAVHLARRFGITLVGFLRGDRANVYSAPERIRT